MTAKRKRKVFHCRFEDDRGEKCTRTYGIRQHMQDGMCGSCADALWEWNQEVWVNNNEDVKLVFEDRGDGRKLWLVKEQ